MGFAQHLNHAHMRRYTRRRQDELGSLKRARKRADKHEINTGTMQSFGELGSSGARLLAAVVVEGSV